MNRPHFLEPFHLPRESAERPLRRALRSAAERLLAFPTLNEIYARIPPHEDDRTFSERVLEALGIRVAVSQDDLQRIPKSGPLVVVANHPFGGIDGLILTALLLRVRPDVRVLANFLLSCMPEMSATMFFVDPFGGPRSAQRNLVTMKAAIRWVTEGGALGIFPAGEVSHLTIRRGCITDPPWSDTVARIVQRTRATTLPVFFEGRNSVLFQIAGLLHPRLRTALLPRELLNKRQQSIGLRVGSPIPPDRLNRFEHAADFAEYLRLRTYILRGRTEAATSTAVAVQQATRPALPPPPPVIPSIAPGQIAAELESLPARQVLCGSGAFCVVWAHASQIPLALREIGRLREITFRAVGEGSGKPLDLDRFDAYYRHLIVWSPAGREIVGGYRMGPTDHILRRYGPSGLYTRKLFSYPRRTLEQMGPALELGRSFIVEKHQKNYAPLMLLWRGISRYVATHRRYRVLFGAVSISDEYRSMTKQLLVAFLKTNDFRSELAGLVRARRPPRFPSFRDCDAGRLATAVRNFEDVDELVSEIESDRRGVPVLLRQYLKLNAKLLGFNIDPEFGDVLDGLLLVDLTRVDGAILRRYMGEESCARFLAYHHVAR